MPRAGQDAQRGARGCGDGGGDVPGVPRHQVRGHEHGAGGDQGDGGGEGGGEVGAGEAAPRHRRGRRAEGVARV